MVAEPSRRRRPVGTCLVFPTLALVSRSTASMEGLQDELMELATRSAELTQRPPPMEAASSTPTPKQILLPSVIDTKLLKQLVTFDGDRTKWADWAFALRAYANAVKSAHASHGRLVGTRSECDRPAGGAHSAKCRTSPCTALIRVGVAREKRSHDEGSTRSCWSRQ